MKQWRPFSGDCLHCGDDAEVFTDSGSDNMAYDGDRARCVSCGCPGVVNIEEEGESCHNGIQWHDEPDCQCEWCLANPPRS